MAGSFRSNTRNPNPLPTGFRFGFLVYGGGININNVRDFLGHESVVTTQVYLTSNPVVTRKAIESIAAQTVPESIQHFSAEERDDLMSFLDSLG